jgi:hypothetical protein
MSRRILPVLLLLFLVAPLLAQTHVAAGIAGGVQMYKNSEDDLRVMTGAELLVKRGRFGVHAAFEYADLSRGGAFVAIHPDLVYIQPIGARYTFLAGMGQTLISIENFDDDRTWNVEAELARRYTRWDVFARARYYDYDSGDVRSPVSPTSPVFSLGARYTLH